MHSKFIRRFVFYILSVFIFYHAFHFLFLSFNSYFYVNWKTQTLHEKKINQTFFFNVTIHTLDANNTIAGGLFIDGNTIKKVINNEDVDYFYTKFRKDPNIVKVNCQGGFMYPGFTDSHGHFLERGFSLSRPNLKGATSVKEIRVRLLNHLYFQSKKKKKKIEELYHDDQWLIGYGWDHHLFVPFNSTYTSSFRLPTKYDLDLDPILKTIPILLHRIDYHAIWVNEKLLQCILKKKYSSIPWFNQIYSLFFSKDIQAFYWPPFSQESIFTGIFKDKEKHIFIHFQPSSSKEEWNDAFMQVQKEMHAFGLTSVHDAGITLNQAIYLQNQAQHHHLKIRIYAMILASSLNTSFPNSNLPLLHHPLFSLSKVNSPSMFTLRSIKVFLDGALGSHGAALFQPYSDLLPTTSHLGDLLYPCSNSTCDELFQWVKQWDAMGLQVCIHAIGDKANHIALNMLSRLPKTSRPRIEHAQVISLEDMFRFSASGIIPSMQPVQFISDSVFLTSYLGPHRLNQVYPWHALFDSGVKYIPLGSDFPVESMDPKLGLYAATHFPKGPKLYKNNAPMTRLQALYGYTKAPAYASFMESKLGQIQSHFLADLSIFSKDFLRNEIHPTQFLNTTTLATIVNGEIVYSNGITISRL